MDPLREMFHHHAWATLALIDYCATLPPDRLGETVPGTFGSILDTLVHLVAADQRYLEVLSGERADPPVREGMELSLAELRSRFEVQTRHWEGALDRVGDLDVTITAHECWPETPRAQNLLLLQAIHHGNDHRTHVCTILGTLGLEVPDIDGWSYWQAIYQ